MAGVSLPRHHKRCAGGWGALSVTGSQSVAGVVLSRHHRGCAGCGGPICDGLAKCGRRCTSIVGALDGSLSVICVLFSGLQCFARVAGSLPLHAPAFTRNAPAKCAIMGFAEHTPSVYSYFFVLGSRRCWFRSSFIIPPHGYSRSPIPLACWAPRIRCGQHSITARYGASLPRSHARHAC